jgi:hypothetical protein
MSLVERVYLVEARLTVGLFACAATSNSGTLVTLFAQLIHCSGGTVTVDLVLHFLPIWVDELAKIEFAQCVQIDLQLFTERPIWFVF